MQKISLPSVVEFIQDNDNSNKATMVISPCYPGYGITIGNAIRRVLLSSLEGSAVTAIKVNGLFHEFDTIPGVKEDIVEIILNFKQLRLKAFKEGEIKLHLKTKKEGEITAQDIEKNSDIEIVNPDLILFTVTDKKADIDVEIFVNSGIGYEPTESRLAGKSEIGVIQIDASYTPVRQIGMENEHVRVGQMTNFDKLSLVIETDGTISPQKAATKAVKILIDHFNFLEIGIAGGPQINAEEVVAEVKEEIAVAEVAEEETDDKADKKKKTKKLKTKK